MLQTGFSVASEKNSIGGRMCGFCKLCPQLFQLGEQTGVHASVCTPGCFFQIF
jgi:hypothetical protein